MNTKTCETRIIALTIHGRGSICVWVLCLGFILAAAFSSQGADAGTTQTNTDLTQISLETLMQMEVPKVSSASKFMQKETEAPASVTVITSEDVKRYGYRTLADLLQSVAGFNVSYDRNYSYLGDRGLSLGDFNSRTLLLVDGHRVNNNLTDGAYIDTAFILDMDLVDHVEVIQGPSAVLYGNNAFFGVINVVTKSAAQINGVEASGGYGSFDSYKGRVTIGKVFTNGIQMLLSGSVYDSAGASKLFYSAYNQPANNNGVAQGLDGDYYGSAFGSLKYGDFTLEGAYNRRVKDNPTAQDFAVFNQPGLKTRDDRGYADLKFEHEFPDIVDLVADVYYDYGEHQIDDPATTSSTVRLDQIGDWWGTELQLKKTIWEKHILTVGAEYRDDFKQEELISSSGINFPAINRTRQSYGVYGEGEVELFKELHVNGGVRYDQYGSFHPDIDPRVAVIYNPFEKSTFKAIYGTAFRAPNFLELITQGFKNVSPEDITSYELVYEQGIGNHLRSSISAFYNDMHDLIVEQNGLYQNINARSEGVELGLDGEWAYGIRGRASYTLQHAKNESQEQDLPDSPEHLLKFNLSVPVVKKKLFASLEFQFTSRRSTFYDNPSTTPGMDVGAYNVVNFTLFSQSLFVKNLDLSASVYNLFDQQYSDPATPFHKQSFIPQNGRTFWLKATYRF